MFAYREVPVEGLGYFSFELLFGRNVKGVLQFIKKSWMEYDLLDYVKATNIIDVVLSLRDRIRTSVEIANEMEEKSKKKGNCWYDKKARDVNYEVGEQVLLLLSLIGKLLQAKFLGPTLLSKG